MKIRLILICIILSGLVLGIVIASQFTETIGTDNAIDLVIPETSDNTRKTKNVSVSVNKGLQYFINAKEVLKNDLESKILVALDLLDSNTITISSDQDIDLKHVVFIMDIANRNKIKSTLAVKSSN